MQHLYTPTVTNVLSDKVAPFHYPPFFCFRSIHPSLMIALCTSLLICTRLITSQLSMTHLCI